MLSHLSSSYLYQIIWEVICSLHILSCSSVFHEIQRPIAHFPAFMARYFFFLLSLASELSSCDLLVILNNCNFSSDSVIHVSFVFFVEIEENPFTTLPLDGRETKSFCAKRVLLLRLGSRRW